MFQITLYLAVFEMHNLYIMWLYVLRFVINKVSMDAFNVLHSKFLLAKLSLFVFGATFAESIWQLISIFSCYVGDKYLSVVKLAWLSG